MKPQNHIRHDPSRPPPLRDQHGKYAKGVSGNPGGEPGWIRKRFTADFLAAFHQHFRHEGARVIARVAKQQPAAYLRCLTMLVPKEMKVEQTGGIKAMTDEQLEAGIAALQDLLARRALAAQGKLIEGSVTHSLPEGNEIVAEPLKTKDNSSDNP